MSAITAIRTISGQHRPGEPGREQRRVGDILIDRDVPIPPKGNRRAAVIVGALKALELKESFVWRTRVNTEAIRQVPGKKFVQRKVGNGPSYRVWRIS